jgi:hypothetical protein
MKFGSLILRFGKGYGVYYSGNKQAGIHHERGRDWMDMTFIWELGFIMMDIFVAFFRFLSCGFF